MADTEQSLAPTPFHHSRLSTGAAEKAVTALVKFREAKSKTEKPKLLEDDEFLYLIVSLKKIPEKSRTKPFRVSLPHALMNPGKDSCEICLIMDDRPKSNLTKDDVKKKIKSESLPVDKVIKLSKLRTDYRPFEAKRKLCDSYDVFFADRRVIPLLPKLLGKQFFKKKKIPLTIDLHHKNWKEQIENACGAALFYVRMGTCSVVKVGKLSMTSNEMAENVVSAVNGIAEIVPGKWKNIRSFHLKLFDSVALPIYQTLPDLKLKINASTIDSDAKEPIEVGKLGSNAVSDEDKSNDETNSMKKKKKKGRIHEARYMDSDVVEMLDVEEIGVDGEDSEKDEKSIAETEGKKRKKVEQANKVKSVKSKKRAKNENPEKKEPGTREKPAMRKKAVKDFGGDGENSEKDEKSIDGSEGKKRKKVEQANEVKSVNSKKQAKGESPEKKEPETREKPATRKKPVKDIGGDGEDSKKDEKSIDGTEGKKRKNVEQANKVKSVKSKKQAKSESPEKKEAETREKPATRKKPVKIEKPVEIEKPAKKVAKVKKETSKEGVKPKNQKKPTKKSSRKM